MSRLPLAAVFVAVLGISASVHAEEVSPEARQQFEVGVQLLDDPAGPRYLEAYDAFRRAYAATPSPRILSNLGLCAMKLERDGEALAAYQRYLAEVDDIAPDERGRIERDLDALLARSGKLIILSPPVGTLVDRRVSTAGAPVVNRYPVEGDQVALVLHAGRHELRVETPSGTSPPVVLDLAPQKTTTVTLSPTPREAPAPSPLAPPSPTPVAPRGEAAPTGVSTATIVLLAGTGALAATTIGLGAAALSTQGDYRDALGRGDHAAAVPLRQRGELLNGVADGFMVGSVVAGSVGLGLLIRDLVRSGEAPVEAGAWLVPGSAGAVVGGRF